MALRNPEAGAARVGNGVLPMSRLIRWSFALARLSFRGARSLALVLLLLLPYVTLSLIVLRIAIGHGALSSRIAATVGNRVNCRATIDDSTVTFFDSSTAYGLRLYARGEEEPFLVAGRAETDLNAARFALRRPVYRVDLYDVDLRLRFDKTNKLLTVLEARPGGPGPLPAFRVRNGRITIDKEGCQPFTLVGVSLTIEPGRRYQLLGVVDDPVWGPIDLDGSLNPRTMAASLRLKNPGLEVTREKLATVPFVPPAFWDRVELSGTKVPLEFRLWLNEKMPKIRYRASFSDLTVTSKEPNRPPFVVGPARGVLLGNEEGLSLDGFVDDPHWGHWTANVHAEFRRGEVTLKLATEDAVRVDQKRLSTLPYVPAVVWQQIDVKDGRTRAKARVRFNFRRKDLRYRVELDVARADVNVTSVGLLLRDAVGRVKIDDGLIELRDVTARTASGNIAGLADLDFRPKPYTLHFDVKGEGLRLSELPAKFGIPSRFIDGNLHGKVDLVVTLPPTGPETTGNGTARVEGAKLFGFIPARPIELRLYGDGSRISVERRVPIRKQLREGATSLPPGSGEPGASAPGSPATRAMRLACATNCFAADGVGRLAGLASRAICLLGAKQAPGEDQTFLDGAVALDEVDLGELVRRLSELEALKDLNKLDVSGKLSLRVRLGVPVNAPTKFSDYRLAGELSIAQLSVNGRQVSRLSAQVDFRNGRLRLDEVSGQAGEGSFSGSASAKVFPPGRLSLDLDVTRLPLAAVAGEKIEGSVSGQVTASAPLYQAKELSAWRGRAVLRQGRLEARGVAASDVSAAVALAEGKLSVTDLRGDVGGARISGSASLSLTGQMPIDVELSVPGANLAVLAASLPPSYAGYKPTGRVALSGKVGGTLSPVALRGGGRLDARSVGAAGFLVDSLAVAFELRDDVLSVPTIEARLYGGTLTGSATVPLGEGAKATMDLTADGLDAGAIGRAQSLPVALGGKIAVRTKVVACRQDGCWSGKANATTQAVVVRNFPVNNLDAELKWTGKRFDYRVEADVLGGKASLDGSYPPPQKRSAGRFDGEVRLERLTLRNLGAALGHEEALRQLDGVLSLNLPYNFSDKGFSPSGLGRVVVRDLRLGDRELADSLTGDLRLSDDGIVLRDITSSFAGGFLRVQGAYRVTDPSRSWFAISLTGADAARLTAVASPKGLISGPIDVNLRGGFGGEITGNGSMTLARGKVFGVEVIGWRLPFEFRIDPSQPRVELTVRESHAQVGSGRAVLDGKLRWAGTANVNGSLRFFDASLASLAGAASDVASYANGRVTGRVDFSGSDMTSLNDLNATIAAKLTDTQALQLPVLKLLVPYLIPGQGATRFQSGELSAQLSRGVLRVRELAVESPLVAILLQGTVTLAQARLDLDVTARTNSFGLDPVVLRLLLRRIPPVGPVPVVVALRATELLSQRTVYLHVTGTVKAPVVQVEPLKTLSDEAVRYFLGLAVAPAPLP